MSCGEVLLGTTAGADAGVGNPAGDRWFTFEVASEGPHVFDTCGSSFDTWLRIYNADETGGSPVPGTLVFSCDDCGAHLCSTGSFRTHLISGVDDLGGPGGHLVPGTRYMLVIEGYSSAEGDYRMTYSCPPSTPPPTPAPSPAPDPNCANGIPSTDGSICCDAQCGQCSASSGGGNEAGCGDRPGGSESCCRSHIENSGRSCFFYPAPCTIDTLSPTPSPTPAPTSPTPSPTPAPTPSPSFPAPTEDIHRGPIYCDATVTATTQTPGYSQRGTPASDHYYSFEASQYQNFTFDSCGSAYDTWLRVYDAAWNQVVSCDDCGVRQRRHTFEPGGTHLSAPCHVPHTVGPCAIIHYNADFI